MMAPRKKRTLVIDRDHSFTQTIGDPASEKPNPFTLASAGLAAKLEQPAPEPVTDAPAVTSEPKITEKPVTTSAQAEKGSAAPKPAKQGRSTSAKATRGKPKDVVPTSRPSGTAAAPPAFVELHISMFIHTELVDRAEKWGEAIHQPSRTIIRHIFNKAKPQLLAELKTIKAGDVDQDRAKDAGYRLQSRLRFTPAEIEDMESRLDPAGFGVLTSMLNFYIRNRFVIFLDEALSAAGY